MAPLLASAGYRVIVPYLRGYGPTRFLSGDTVRNGQQSVVAVDIIALMDALKVEKATIGGYDWDARTADFIAALWPDRCKALVSVSGYLIGNHESGKSPLPPCRGHHRRRRKLTVALQALDRMMLMPMSTARLSALIVLVLAVLLTVAEFGPAVLGLK